MSRKLPGVQNNQQIQLSNQWSLKPAGKQVGLGDFPVNMAVHPKGHFAAILHAGFGEHEIAIVALDTCKIVDRVSLPNCFYGICFDPTGKTLFASGGEKEVVHQFKFAQGYLSEHQEYRVADKSKKGVVAGISCSADAHQLFVANAWADNLALLPLDDPRKIQFIALPQGSYPYATLPSPDGSKLYVSLWGKSAVAVLDLKTKTCETQWKTKSHPTEMALSPDGNTLYTACADSNAVTATDTATGKVLETIETALYPQAPNG
ncbi:MAG: YncE family protein, partial [Thermoguttaceae bacterium]